MGDVNVLDFLPVEAGAFYVMDRGYLDFARLYKMHQAGAFFVTRAKQDAVMLAPDIPVASKRAMARERTQDRLCPLHQQRRSLGEWP